MYLFKSIMPKSLCLYHQTFQLSNRFIVIQNLNLRIIAKYWTKKKWPKNYLINYY